MGAITGIVYTGRRIPFPSATPGGLVAEVWRIPASTAADTQTIVSPTLEEILFILGPVSHIALAGNSADLITSVTVASSNFVEMLVVGLSKT